MRESDILFLSAIISSTAEGGGDKLYRAEGGGDKLYRAEGMGGISQALGAFHDEIPVSVEKRGKQWNGVGTRGGTIECHSAEKSN